MLRTKVTRIRLKCPKHPGYNPEKKGPAFRANCRECWHLWTVYQKVLELRRLLGEEVGNAS